MRIFRSLGLILGPILGLASLFAGCASGPPPPVPMTCAIDASKQINLTSNGRPSPVLLRLYGLKSAAAFNNADFVTLYQHDATELATDLTTKDEFTLTPGETSACSKVLPPDTRFLGVLVAFRDVEHATWRAVAGVEGGKRATVVVNVDTLSVKINVAR